ncbi:phospholipid carrier-dependent glycosyltransferase [Singulisphaera sp. PoT]|uniref:phospholipid carrier-dependent glycosyltransferase n=1 Tax=Singulisphaera sp. PoT TaxID=3411797 RepID=UPI003BF591A7
MDDRRGERWRRAVRAATTLALLAIVGGLGLLSFGDERPHVDEVYWIGSAYYFDLAVVRGELDHPDWRLLPARENPPMGKYLIGAALYAGGIRVKTLDALGSYYLTFWEWGEGEDRAKRQAVVDRMTPGVERSVRLATYRPIRPTELYIGRALVILLGFGSALGVASIGRACSGRATGAIASLAFASHPIIILAYARTLVDIIALFFSIVAVRLLLATLRPAFGGPGRSRAATTGLGIATGLALALACGSKMNALVVAALAGVVWLRLVVRAIGPAGRSARAPAVGLGIGGLVAAAVFVGSNPALYPDLRSGLFALMEEHRRTAQLQVAFLGKHIWLDPGADRLLAVAKLVGIRPEAFLAVVLAAAWQSVDGLRRFSHNTVVCLWWWISVALVVVWIPFAWERYAAPAVPPSVLVVAKTLVDAIGAVRHRSARWRGGGSVPGPVD